MPVTIEHLGVRLNLNNPEDRRIYDKLQDYPKGERSKVMKEALLRYLDNTDGEKSAESRVQGGKRTSRGKKTQEVIGHYKDKPAPAHVSVETVENPVPAKAAISKAEKDSNGGNDTKATEDARDKLRNLVY